MSTITSVKGKIHVLRDALLHAPQVITNSTSVKAHTHTIIVTPPAHTSENYALDQFFGPYFKGIYGELPGDKIQLESVNHMIADFKMSNDLLFYKDKFCSFSLEYQGHLATCIRLQNCWSFSPDQ